MSETIHAKLEASRKELLDLGLRNPLLNYKPSKVRGVSIRQEKSLSIYDILVNQAKAMTFLGRPTKDGTSEIEFIEMEEIELQESYSDTKLQTNETELALQNKLLNTYYSARTSLEEQGVNILYISLGMLHWYEADSSEEARLAPLVLVPVSLERSSAKERFRLKYTLEEVGGNISLQAKMKMEFGLDIPDFIGSDEPNLSEYFNSISKVIEKNKRWNIEQDTIELGFFSFGKFMIYNDLDSSKWPQEHSPLNHPILQNLFEKGFKDSQLKADESTFIDTETPAHQMYQVVDADSSQLLAILAVNEGKNLVIQGPPGTGKSQTITNIIANAVGNGKKVLFVAEKMAALEVVKRRLDTVHLGEACLELHSHKANKKQLHEELKKMLDLGKPTYQQLEKDVALLDGYKKELNEYCAAINSRIGSSELTAHQIIGHLLKLAQLPESTKLVKMPILNPGAIDAEKMNRAEAFCERVQARLKDIGTPVELLFWGIGLKVLLPHEQEPLLDLFRQSKTIVEGLEKEAVRVAGFMNFEEPLKKEQALQLKKNVSYAGTAPDLEGIAIENTTFLTNSAEIEELLKIGEKLSSLRSKYEEVFISEAWSENVLELRQNFIAHGHKWYKFLIGDYTKSNKRLGALCKSALPKDNATKITYVDTLLEAKRLETVLNEQETLAKELFGKRWQKLKSDWHTLSQASHYLKDLHLGIKEGNYAKELILFLQGNPDASQSQENQKKLTSVLEKYDSCINMMIDRLQLNESLRFSDSQFIQQPYISQTGLFESWIKRFNEIHQAISWNNLEETAIEANFDYIVQAARNWKDAKDLLKFSLQKTWYEYLLEQAITAHSALRKFDRAHHEQATQQFRQLDLLNLQYNRAKAAFKHWENIPKTDAGGQIGVLRKEFNKKSRHLPIRQLIKDAGLAIQALKPVFMMSPLSIANFLPPGALQFDLVVFDEASQVRPVDSLGALLRGKQLVVVGDTKQLPPTSFFDSLTKEVNEDEENVTADIQSILGMCDAQGASQRMLRWHYRSRHESLISLSNHEFYENKLVVFPSPGSKYRMGLAFHHLKDTFYDRGKTRTNPKEAEIVADAVIDHARKNPKLTLGVVAFSTAQRTAIFDALEKRRRQFPEVEDYFKRHPHEPFFVKNLENVQGDERDVIFISIGYGRTQEGYVSMSFGPLNNEGGERRLNVLITRAKIRCEIFTNITSDDIDIARTKSYGIRALKNFLYFAQHGKLNLTEETGLSFDSPFEEMVADKLTECGYIVRKQVGSQGFRIDLAIVDPENPGRYLIGVECDGASYHSARSARDRDRLRQQVLDAIGWKIHRIWSTDWFRNPERELKRAIEIIERAKELVLLDDDAYEQEEKAQEQEKLSRETVENTGEQIPLYQFGSVSSEIQSQEFHLHPVGKLSAWIVDIVRTESPVHFDELAKRLVEAAGITRIGQRIKESIQKASMHSHQNKQIIIKGDFLWHSTMNKPIIRDRSNLPAASRKLKLISPEEIHLALEKVVKESLAIQPDAAIPIVAKLFGFNRLTDELKTELTQVIQGAVNQRIIHHEGDLLKMPQN